MSSVFVTSQSQWKLSGFEFAQPFDEMNKEITELLELLLHDGDNLIAVGVTTGFVLLNHLLCRLRPIIGAIRTVTTYTHSVV